MSAADMHWGLWWRQIQSVIRLEMRKTFFAKRGIWVYLLALAPVALFLLDSVVVDARSGPQSGRGRGASYFTRGNPHSRDGSDTRGGGGEVRRALFQTCFQVQTGVARNMNKPSFGTPMARLITCSRFAMMSWLASVKTICAVSQKTR